MSKAFTRESDDLPERPTARPQPTRLPPGTKNYMTPDGAQRLRTELDHLMQVERPSIAATSNKGSTSHELQILDQRIQQLQQSLASATIVPPPVTTDDRVRFGATVTVRNKGGEESTYRIVGVDETDIDHGWVSWLSPIAKALLNSEVGQRVRFKLPQGEEELEIVAINYDLPPG